MSMPAEQLSQRPSAEIISRPYFQEVPRVYRSNTELIDRANQGETLSQQQVFQEYFHTLETEDPIYMQGVKHLVAERQRKFAKDPSDMSTRKLQIIVPAYREGENITAFLQTMKQQFGKKKGNDWGVSFVFDYAIPYRNPQEPDNVKRMQEAVDTFLDANPQLKGRVDYMFYTRKKTDEVLPVGMARKIGEDVLMYEKMLATSQRPQKHEQPLYLGLMDIDAGTLTPGLIRDMAKNVPSKESDTPRAIRVGGSFDSTDVAARPYLHPLHIMFEGSIAAVGKETKYNPFTIGRLSAVPARELAMTGGGFAKKLQFTDEDIRHGIQMAWQLKNFRTVEVPGKYSTSARREVHTMHSVLQMLRDNGGQFTVEALEVAGLIRMYSNWANETFRRDLGNVLFGGDGGNPLQDSAEFARVVPKEFIQTMINTAYRFTTFAMFAIDELSQTPFVPELDEMKKKFLAGEMSHFEVELNTQDVIKSIFLHNPQRFEQIKPALMRADKKSRDAVKHVLDYYHVNYRLEDQPPIYGILEDAGKQGEERDRVVLHAPFVMLPDQSGYMRAIAREVGAKKRAA